MKLHLVSALTNPQAQALIFILIFKIRVMPHKFASIIDVLISRQDHWDLVLTIVALSSQNPFL